MAVPYTTITTENLGDDQTRIIRGHEIALVGVALNVLVELTISAPYRPDVVQRLVDEEIFLSGLTLADLAGLSFSVLDTETLDEGQRRIIRGYTVPTAGRIISIVNTTEYKQGAVTRTIVKSERLSYQI